MTKYPLLMPDDVSYAESRQQIVGNFGVPEPAQRYFVNSSAVAIGE